MNPLAIGAAVINGVSGWFKGKQDIKKAKVTAKAKLEQMRASNDHSVELTDAEWESLAVQTQNDSWKDEYITIIVTAPIVTILLGSIMAAVEPVFRDVTSDDYVSVGVQIVEGTINGIIELQELGMDYGIILNAVVFAAVGLKLWRA